MFPGVRVDLGSDCEGPFDGKRKVEFHGAMITSNSGPLDPTSQSNEKKLPCLQYVHESGSTAVMYACINPDNTGGYESFVFLDTRRTE